MESQCHTSESELGKDEEVKILGVRLVQHGIGAVEIIVNIAHSGGKL